MKDIKELTTEQIVSLINSCITELRIRSIPVVVPLKNYDCLVNNIKSINCTEYTDIDTWQTVEKDWKVIIVDLNYDDFDENEWAKEQI